jgi:hypothetical protein
MSGNNLQSEIKPLVKRGAVSVNSEIQHLSVILYRIPVARASRLAPQSLPLELTLRKGESFASLSVVSYLDVGSPHEGHIAFEQTSYRLHVTRDGQPGFWLLGISIGSLTGVGMRNMWSLPWRLSAMEFQIAYDQATGRYNNYKLQTQSQWDNSMWEIIDSGGAPPPDQEPHSGCRLLSTPAQTIDHYFQRRDGAIGLYQMRYGTPALTPASLKFAHSDLCERLGLLSSDELQRPEKVAVQRQTTCQIFSPAVLGGRRSQSLMISEKQRRLVQAA